MRIIWYISSGICYTIHLPRQCRAFDIKIPWDGNSRKKLPPSNYEYIHQIKHDLQKKTYFVFFALWKLKMLVVEKRIMFTLLCFSQFVVKFVFSFHWWTQMSSFQVKNLVTSFYIKEILFFFSLKNKLVYTWLTKLGRTVF